MHNFNIIEKSNKKFFVLNFSTKPKAFNVTYRATYRDCYLIT